MKPREYLNRRLWPIALGASSGVGLLLTGLVIGVVRGESPRLVIMLPGLALTVVSGIIAHVILRCPRCHGNLVALLTQGPRFSVDPLLRFCPYCGKSLDDDIPGERALANPELIAKKELQR